MHKKAQQFLIATLYGDMFQQQRWFELFFERVNGMQFIINIEPPPLIAGKI
jgi:hypothetical protein